MVLLLNHSIPFPQTIPPIHFFSMTTMVNIKLDRTNYPLWLAQILHILKSRDLMGYVDGTLVCPPKHMTGVGTVNPTYTSWMQ
ncbi:hypothetical protein ACFX13_045975 [Malus domestica]